MQLPENIQKLLIIAYVHENEQRDFSKRIAQLASGLMQGGSM